MTRMLIYPCYPRYPWFTFLRSVQAGRRCGSEGVGRRFLSLYDYPSIAEPIAPVNRRYRSPLGVGGEFGRVIHDSARPSAAVTELHR